MPKLAKQSHDAESLGHVLEDLNKIAADLQSLIESMNGNGVDSVEVRYDGEVLRALKYLPRFVSDGHDEVRVRLIESRARYKPSVQRRSPQEMDDEINAQSKRKAGQKKKPPAKS